MYSPKRRFRLFRNPAFTGGGGPVISDTTVYTYSWAEQLGAPAQRYANIDVDNTGDILISTRWTATDGAEGPYISINGGATWARKVSGMTFSASANTHSVCLARSDPDIMYATVSVDGYVYKSTNQGESWTALLTSGSRNWSGVKCNSTGTIIVAAVSGGNLYKSTDSGSTWSAMTGAGTPQWDSVFVSEDGMVIVGAPAAGNLTYSVNGGTNWTFVTSLGSRTWRGISGSADGSILFASYVGTSIGRSVLSTDSGSTWTVLTFTGANTHWNTATSINGNKLVTAIDTGSVWLSQDMGATWTEQTTPGTRGWEGLAITPDGSKIIAGTIGSARPWIATGA